MARRQSRARRGGFGQWTLLFLLGLYLAGFALYIFSLPHIASASLSSIPRAAGIVVLTGGNARLQAAVSLLENGAGQRLLITGVNPQTKKDELKVPVHGGPRFDCCVDLGFAATDTRGNAREAAKWARTHKYQSLIVVTADYHMPRTLLEFGEEMPEVKLVPYAVEIEETDPSGGWDLRMLRILNGEYVKYVASLVRLAIERATAPQADSAHKRK